MGLEVRPAEPDELDEFNRVACIALMIPRAQYEAMHPEWTLCAFEDGKLCSTSGSWPLTMRLNGVGTAIAGVSAVSTLPMYRRRGYLRQVMTTFFRQLHAREEKAIAALYASMAAIYQRYGYAVVTTKHSYRFDPRFLQFALAQPVSGTLREAGEDEMPLLVDLYRLFREDKMGYVHRGRAMWKAGVFAPPPPGGQLMTVVYEEAGKPLGYLAYAVEPKPGRGSGPGQKIEVRDLVWLNFSAYRAAWDYLARMDLVTEIKWEMVPPDDPLPHLILEPRELHTTAQDGVLARIVDVARGLPQRRYTEEGTLTFEVIDDVCPWNQGCWRAEVSPEGVAVKRTEESPQLVMPVSTLAMLFFNQLSATQTARMQRLSVADGKALPVWDRVMHTMYRPFCADHF